MHHRTSPGLSIHIRNMFLDLDPSSENYLKYPQQEEDTIDESRYQLGAHRAPSGTEARRAFLWRPLSDVGYPPAYMLDTPTIVDCLEVAADAKIVQAEDMMRVAGEVFQSVLMRHCRSSLEDDDYDGDIYAFPIWQETTSVYLQLATRIPYLLHVKALLACCRLPQLMTLDICGSIHSAVMAFNHVLLSKPCRSLVASVELAKGLKRQGDDELLMRNQCFAAITFYIRAMMELLPWFPSEYYIAPWESRVSGVGRLVAQCSINIALAILDGLTDFNWMLKSAYQLLAQTATLSCITNWEKAKMLHLQAKCSQKLLANGAIQKKRASAIGTHPILSLSQLHTLRGVYLANPPGQLANEPWMGDLSPKYFSAHYLALCRRLQDLPQRSLPWWAKHEGPEVVRMVIWLGKMTEMKADYEMGNDSEDGLDEDNARVEAEEGEAWL